jgi:hypothetical protein
MRLICDDYNQVYIWVEDLDEDIELSPRFDYEEDAVIWKNRIESLLNKEKK